MTKDKMHEMHNDVFGILTNAQTGKDELVILKSKAMKSCMELDGMSYEDFLEHWDYNIAGSKGKYSYSVVDDTLESWELQEILDNDEEGEIINPPYIKD